MCGFQRQRVDGSLYGSAAHERLTGAVPPIFDKVLPLYIDEDPLDAFFYGRHRGESNEVSALTPYTDSRTAQY